jgi:hypothetical protein
MEDNRFMRVYNEFKKEQEGLKYSRVEPNNRFSCLVENNNNISKKEPNRFECLVDRNYESYPRSGYSETTYLPRVSESRPTLNENYSRNGYSGTTTYLPRVSEPRESVNERMKRYKEEQAKKPPPPPEFSINSDYHFPELVQKIPVMDKPKMPEASVKKEMIVNEVIIKKTQSILTSLCWHNGKLVKKEIYEDGTEVSEDNPRVILKKPVYSSWASAVKSEVNNIVYNNMDEF